jgi:putative peptide zinc metalloprotease protein
MEESLFNPSWYRVSKIKPRLRKQAQIHRHYYSGEPWYVLQDHATGQFYRFTPILFQVIGLMDGNLTMQELWEKAMDRFGDDAPTQGDMVRLLSQLHSANILQCDIPPDTEELFRRQEQIGLSKLKYTLRSPLAVRLPLLDPERFLNRTIHIVRPIFSIYGVILWLAVVITGVTLAGLHWSELTKGMVDRILSAQNLVLIWFIYPVVKAFHEFGHAYAVKKWGGEVHEMGIMFLVLMPVPYVDASSSTAFPEKWRRVLVDAAGIMTELCIAALALFVWINAGEGLVRAVAYNVIIVASVSTILFNGNPLLRYDGYYVLSDILEIPNLTMRSINYLGYLFKRYLFNLKKIDPPYIAPGERFWLFSYSIASFIYRIFIYAAIILFISGKFFIVGLLLGIWAVFSMVIIPTYKRLNFVLFSPVLRDKRLWAILTSGFLITTAFSIIFFMPFPSWTRAEGIVWVPEDALVRAGTDCFVSEIKIPTNTIVKKDEVLMTCDDPLLITKIKVLKAQLKDLQARYNLEICSDRVQAKITKEDIIHVRGNLARAQERSMNLTIRSPSDGLFILPKAEDLPDSFLKQGELVAYVINVDKPIVRVVVPQSGVDLVRKQNRGIEIRFADNIDKIFNAVMIREIPGGVQQLPSTVLGSAGGGKIAIDPTEPSGLKAVEKLFQFDIEMPSTVRNIYIGSRVFVRFDHGFEPLATQWYRSIRRLFLKRFNV